MIGRRLREHITVLLAHPRFSRRAYCASVVAATIIGTAITAWAAGRFTTTLGPGELSDLVVIHKPRVVVVKSSSKLYLFDGDVLVRVYSVKLGSMPGSPKARAGDGRTPEGRFVVCTKKADSPHHRFLGINYPGREVVEQGLRTGRISVGEASAILKAHDERRCPPWTTALGGGIGLHGSARSLERTAGCIAVNNEQIEELFNVLRIGDEVEILP